jgi:hypothetical protein
MILFDPPVSNVFVSDHNDHHRNQTLMRSGDNTGNRNQTKTHHRPNLRKRGHISSWNAQPGNTSANPSIQRAEKSTSSALCTSPPSSPNQSSSNHSPNSSRPPAVSPRPPCALPPSYLISVPLTRVATPYSTYSHFHISFSSTYFTLSYLIIPIHKLFQKHHEPCYHTTELYTQHLRYLLDNDLPLTIPYPI